MIDELPCHDDRGDGAAVDRRPAARGGPGRDAGRLVLLAALYSSPVHGRGQGGSIPDRAGAQRPAQGVMTMRRDPELLRDSLPRRRLLELMGLGGAAVLAGCAPAARPAAGGQPSVSAPAGAAPAPAASPAEAVPIRFSMTSRTAG